MARRRGCGGEGSVADAVLEVADAASWYCALFLLLFILLGSLTQQPDGGGPVGVRGGGLARRRPPCDEIYVVGEGETLHTISDKCGDPFIVERNPHIHDPDDVFPGLVIKITPSAVPAEV